MSQFYERTKKADSPVELADVKSYLKLPSAAGPDDTLIQLLIDSATDYAEKYTTRDLRKNRWKVLIDVFTDRICLRRDPINSITLIQRQVSGVLTPVATTVYYLKNNTQFSEVLLQDGEDWPTDVDEREHAIEITFQTKAHRCLDQVTNGIYRHVSFLYENRGDCDPTGLGVTTDAAVQSGATKLYDQVRISRV